MTEAITAAAVVEDPTQVEFWILALVTAADDDELLHVGVAACAAGHSQTLVQCGRCSRSQGASLPMSFPAMVRHVRTVERAYRGVVDDGPNTAAHGYHDITALRIGWLRQERAQ